MDSVILLLSETTLALYPILIKVVSTSFASQILWRFITFSLLGFTFASWPDIQKTWLTGKGVLTSLALGFLTLTHVGTSYYAFQELSAGSSMSLFYTYPFWILFGAAVLYGESISMYEVLLVGIAFLGTVLIAYGSREEKDENSKKEISVPAILSAIAAAFTEAAMYFAVRGAETPNPFFSVLQLYPGALALLIPLLSITGSALEKDPKTIGQLFTFNAVIGFFGYALRFYVIPRVPTIVFSLLSFVGVLASFIWGSVFVGEKPNWITVSGASAIVLSSGLLTLTRKYQS